MSFLPRDPVSRGIALAWVAAAVFLAAIVVIDLRATEEVIEPAAFAKAPAADDERKAQMQAIEEMRFDFFLIARSVFQEYWSDATEEQRAESVTLLRTILESTAVANARRHLHIDRRYVEAEEVEGFVRVRIERRRFDEWEAQLALMHRVDGQWRVVDARTAGFGSVVQFYQRMYGDRRAHPRFEVALEALRDRWDALLEGRLVQWWQVRVTQRRGWWEWPYAPLPPASGIAAPDG